jgi:hypothetical protein
MEPLSSPSSEITKFPAARPESAYNEIYVSRKRPLKVYYDHALKLV